MDILRDMAIDDLLKSSIGQQIQQAMSTISEIQRVLYAIADNDNPRLKLLRMATVFQLFLIDTLATKRTIGNLTEEDWADIAQKVAEYAVYDDGQGYCEFVFNTYADYIDLSADVLSQRISEDTCEAIRKVSAEIRENTGLLDSGELSETVCTENCLWLSLEGMVKLLSSSLEVLVGEDYASFARALAQFAFEYGRYTLYAKEQAVLTEYIENQYRLDELIQNQYEAYMAEVNAQAERFQNIIKEAFSENIQDKLRSSVLLAQETGVSEDEILKSVDDIDNYFL